MTSEPLKINGMNDLITTIKNGVNAMNAIQQALIKVFPQGEIVTNSSSGSSGKFLTIIASDGNTYKIPLNNP